MDVVRDSEPKWTLIVVVFIIIGMASSALGFGAEATSPRLYEVLNKIGGGCTYPRSPAHGLAIAALVTLVIFRFHCPRIRKHSSKTRLCLISSWVAWLAAMSLYVIGLGMIANQAKELRYDSFKRSYIVCHVVKPGIFGAGASFVLVCVVLEIITHVFISSL
ncbi:hypothetical protein QVD17_25812 [Tagetes erecta]|uniref:Uncharacterized protein n=1 Tax=Tagetes erecta TaxID=13708 RepID=A0AAD8K9Q7_TARER|nr:hypothetical protein QVD17_25812 [Tagetes erecta]